MDRPPISKVFYLLYHQLSINKVNILLFLPTTKSSNIRAATMPHPKTQEILLQRLKTRGPQSVKILSKQLDITTMGVRQHLNELAARGR